MRLALVTAASAFMLVFAILALGVVGGYAGERICGHASYYGSESGNRTANGEHFDGSSLTAASLTLPFGTKLLVTYRGRSVVVRVNDRGPYIKGRFLDLSRAAARQLGMIEAGVANVCAERL